MTTNAYTLPLWISAFKSQSNVISDFIMKWPISDGSTAIFYMEDTVLSKYTAELEKFRVSVDLTDREQHFYAYNPRLFAYDLYGYPEFWYIVLYANEMHTTLEFHPTRVKFFTSGVVNVLNEIRILEQSRKDVNEQACTTLITNNQSENADLLTSVI